MSDNTQAINAGQAEYWNGIGAEKWLKSEVKRERTLMQLGAPALETAAARPGERAVDIGCGTGPTTAVLAAAVGASGQVLGVDVSRRLVEAAKARTAKFGNVDIALGDAASHSFEPGAADLVFSRFGVMFFGDPVAAFANIRRALKPGGRMVFQCWRSLKENTWAFIPFMAAVPHLPPMQRPPPGAPGPFAFAESDRVVGILGGAGFADVRVARVDSVMTLSETGLDDAVTVATETGPVSRAMFDAPEAMRRAAVEAVRQTLAVHMKGETLALPAACWIFSARNPT